MKLDFEQIISVATGFVGYEIKDNKIFLKKCTQKQIDFWYSQKQVLGERAETTTGVRLDFITDSSRFFAKVSQNRFEVKLNGVTVLKKEDGGTLDIALSGKSNRVTVVFPCHHIGYIESVELSDGATFTPCEYDRRFLFLGDSITQGYNSQYDSLCYSQRVTDFFDATSVINGIGGSYFAKDSFDIPYFDPDTVIVAYGCNDFSHYKTQDVRLESAKEFLSLVSENYKDKKLFYVMPIHRRDLDGDRLCEFKKLREDYKAIAVGYGFNIIDGFLAIADMDDFYADALHPNDLGFSTYADYVIKRIQQI